MPKPWENSSGCADPTAYAAVKTASKDEQAGDGFGWVHPIYCQDGRI